MDGYLWWTIKDTELDLVSAKFCARHTMVLLWPPRSAGGILVRMIATLREIVCLCIY